jgi:hypothetical protein
MKISATWSSSSIATRVSWALEEMIISLLMPDSPLGPSDCRGRNALLVPAPRMPHAKTHEQRSNDAAQDECRDGQWHFGEP